MSKKPLRRLNRLTLIGLITAATSVMLSAQITQKPGQTPTFRSGTDIVTTDLYVFDDKRRFVPGLTADDFELFEDGVKQKISQFVAIIGGRAMNQTVTPYVEATEGLILPRAVKPPELGRIFIVFIDDLHFQPQDSILAKRVLREIRDTILHENDLVGLVSSGYSSVSFDLNPDPRHTRFDAAIEKTMGAGKTPIEILQALQTVDGPAGLKHDAAVAFKTAYEILSQAERVTDRRKAFLFVSSGYDFNPFTNARWKYLQETFGPGAAPTVERPGRQDTGDPISQLGSNAGVDRNPFETGSVQFADADLAMMLHELIGRARRANVAFYPIDPRGLMAGPDIATGISAEEWNDFYNTSIASLEAIAAGTGGKCACRMNNYTKFLQQVDNEMSDYYIIGYESTNLDPMRVNRRIKITSKKPEVKEMIYNETYRLRRRGK